MTLELLCYIGIGALAGFFAGLLGVGGGAIIGPLLILVFTDLLLFDAAYVAHLAVATACGVIVLTAPVSAFTHARRQRVDWNLAMLLSIGVIIGAGIGVGLAAAAPGGVIKVLLVLLLLSNTLSMLRPQPSGAASASGRGAKWLLPSFLLPVACFIGGISALLGIGGGVLTVPYLNRHGVQIYRAIGTSAFIGIPLSLSAVVGYIWTGQQQPQLPEGSWGYLYLPALWSVSIFSVVAAYGGARLSGLLPAALLRKIFGVLSAVIALRLIATLLPE